MFNYWKYEFLDFWDRLRGGIRGFNLREYINENPKAIMVCSGICVLILVVTLISTFSNSSVVNFKKQKSEWYYDLNTGELFTAKIGLEVPIKAPSGPLPNGELAGVRAYVFTCATCDKPNESDYYIGFIEKLDPKCIGQEPPANLSGSKRWGYGRLIKRVEDKNWVSANSSQGRQIQKSVFSPDENGQIPKYFPPVK